MAKDGGPAYPDGVCGKEHDAMSGCPVNDGMSLLDYFAGLAMSRFDRVEAFDKDKEPDEYARQVRLLAEEAFDLAEEMVAESKRRREVKP